MRRSFLAYTVFAAVLNFMITFMGTVLSPDVPVGLKGWAVLGLTEKATAEYAAILGRRESKNRYGIRNRFGYSGRWQMGAAALFDTGYVSTKRNKDLGAEVWTAKAKALGVNSLQEFLANKNGIQDLQFVEYTNMNYRSLVRLGVIRPGMPQAEIAGWLAAAHLKGVGGAAALARGRDNRDANGTTASSYYRMMARISKAG